MIISRVALAFALAAEVPASFADASPLRFRRRLGDLQDGADLMDGTVQGDQELQDGMVLIDPVEEDKHKSTCKSGGSGDDGKTCETDYEKIDAAGLPADAASTACALIGEGWDVCTLGQICPSNSNGAAMKPTLPAPKLIEKYGTFLFPGDAYAPYLSAADGALCSDGGSVQLGTGGGGVDLCEIYMEPGRRRLVGCPEATNSGVICCGCEKTRAPKISAVEHSYRITCPSPASSPSAAPSEAPSSAPSESVEPSALPSDSPSKLPSDVPSVSPSDVPSDFPSDLPSDAPSLSSAPSLTPSSAPSESAKPSSQPSALPSMSPSDVPSNIPSNTPSDAPSVSAQPSAGPSAEICACAEKCYVANETADTWTAHQDVAIMRGCQLASISNDTEEALVVDAATVNMLMSNSNSYHDYLPLAWVGLDRPADNASKSAWGEWTDGCTYTPYLDLNWATNIGNEPNNGGEDSDVSSQTVAAILFDDVTIGTISDFKGMLHDEDKNNQRPAIYECCKTSGQCPTPSPTPGPSPSPSDSPTSSPSDVPSNVPSNTPSDVPSDFPSDVPSNVPSSTPSDVPSNVPSSTPSDVPSNVPSKTPSDVPSDFPSDLPSNVPSSTPSDVPSNVPSKTPSDVPSDFPSDVPSNVPSSTPSDVPSVSAQPSAGPSAEICTCGVKCYVANEEALNWTAHQNEAIMRGCQLASISNMNEQADVVAAAAANMLMSNSTLYYDQSPLAWVGLDRPADNANLTAWGEWTDGCTYGLWNGNLTWASGYPNNGGIGGSRNQTVAAISFSDVTIGMGLIKPAGKLYDDEPVNKRPAIYECCDSSGQCPTPSPTPGSL